jgi:hypothetical protein
MGRILTLLSPEISELRFHNKLNNSTYSLLCVTSCHQIFFVICIKQLKIKMNGQLIVLSIVYIHVNLPAGAFFSRFWGSLPSLPSTFKIFRPWKKSSTIKSWPTFCDQFFWKFPIWNSRTDEKCWEIRMVKVNVIFNDIRLLICLTPLQVNWVMVIN